MSDDVVVPVLAMLILACLAVALWPTGGTQLRTALEPGPCECGHATQHPDDLDVCAGMSPGMLIPVIEHQPTRWFLAWPVTFLALRATGERPYPVRACMACVLASWRWQRDNRPGV